MRRAYSILVTCALLLGFMEAPFAHVHERASGGEHHATEQAHPHIGDPARSTAGSAFDQLDPADDHRLVNWFQTVQQTGFVLYFAPGSSAVMEPVWHRDFIRTPPSVRGHDPPLIAAGPSRAPPIIPA